VQGGERIGGWTWIFVHGPEFLVMPLVAR